MKKNILFFVVLSSIFALANVAHGQAEPWEQELYGETVQPTALSKRIKALQKAYDTEAKELEGHVRALRSSGVSEAEIEQTDIIHARNRLKDLDEQIDNLIEERLTALRHSIGPVGQEGKQLIARQEQLMKAIEQNDIATVKELATQINVNFHDENGTTPLTRTLEQTENIGVVNALLEHGANVNLRDNSGILPLTWAVTTKNIGIVALLLEHHASVHNWDALLENALALELDETFGEPEKETLIQMLMKAAETNVGPAAKEYKWGGSLGAYGV